MMSRDKMTEERIKYKEDKMRRVIVSDNKLGKLIDFFYSNNYCPNCPAYDTCTNVDEGGEPQSHEKCVKHLYAFIETEEN